MLFRTAFILLVATVFALDLNAANSDTASVTIQVQPINEIDISESQVSLAVSSATPGSQPDSATDTATYSITTNCGTGTKKLTASINSDMPANVTLQIRVSAPAGASSSGYVSLGTTAVDVVTGVSSVAAGGLSIDFRLNATVSAGVVSLFSRSLTLTLSDPS